MCLSICLHGDLCTVFLPGTFEGKKSVMMNICLEDNLMYKLVNKNKLFLACKSHKEVTRT